MDTSLKRIVAFVIDILLVTCVVSLVTKVLPIDPYKDKYNESYQEYMKIMEDTKDVDNIDDYKDRLIELNYEIYHYHVFSNGISIVSLLIYFGIIQMILGGQTVGKKIMNLRLVSKNEEKTINVWQYLLRAIILNNVIFTVINIISVYVFKGTEFYYVSYVMSILQTLVYMIIVLMVVLRKDNRGIHDMIAGTKVIDLKPFVVDEEKVIKETKKKKVVKK